MKRSLSLLLCGGILATACAPTQQPAATNQAETTAANPGKSALASEVQRSLEKVKPEDIKAHIAYLADDKLKGRLPGTEGYQLAVDYVIDQYKAMGIEPGGENGTYLQLVRLRKATPGPDAKLISTDSKGKQEQLVLGKDFAVYPNLENPRVSVEAPLVFAGYGISAPELGYDDYADLDVKGKIVVIVRGAPEKFPSTVASSSMDAQTILTTAADHGAVGVLIALTDPKASAPNLQRGVNSVMGPDGKVAVSRTHVSDQIKLYGVLSGAVFQKLLEHSNLQLVTTTNSLKAGKSVTADLQTKVSGSYTTTYEDIESHNVVGKITGSDATLREEYVVHSAHLDHVGIGKPVDGDSIYNGAHDNASGVASLLEIGRIYSRIEQKPKRSVLLVMVTAEEMGLLGSAYFAKMPTVPKASIVANVNTDMPAIIAPLLSVVPLGAKHSSLMKQVEEASAHLGLTIEEDPEPEQNRFVRSDQYSFVSQGIPALHIKYGNKTADGKNNLSEFVQEWRAKYYHKPQDGLDGIFDFEAGKTYVQLNFLIGYKIAQAAERPTWNTGDYFGERFGTATTGN